MKKTPLLHLVRLARRLNTMAADEAKTPFLSTLEDFKSITDLAYKCIFGAGVLSVLGYLLFSIKFYPPGVEIGDSLFFLMAALAFSLAYTLFLCVGFFLGRGILWAVEKLQNKPKLAWLVGGLSLGAIFLLTYAYSHNEIVATILQAVSGFTLSGMCLALVAGFGKNIKGTPPPPGVRLVFAIVGLLVPVVFAPAFVQRLNENVVMPSVGVRLKNVTLRLSEQNYEIVASAANGQNLAALSCSTSSSGQPERLVHGVNLLWHGIGERSLVELPADPGKEPAKGHSSGDDAAKKVSLNPIVELAREGVFALRNYQGPIERCLELRGDVLFESGLSRITDDRGELDDMLAVLDTNKLRIKRIQVIGHADAVGYSGGAFKNNKLALDRANEVKRLIEEKIGASSVEVTAVGRGAREPKTLCKDWPVKATLSECLAQNRRVEVRIEFRQEKITADERPSAG